ncbi:hypothetical protein F5Y06DRAFT_151541 [Hypoxylon sp. FL0890]|nr:hypothetical protein F5Y06DRAFT_151541 [Hypoxylon sp. FL0890]
MAWSVAKFVALAVVFAVLAIISVALRFWARTVTKARFGIHDALIIPAMLCVVGIAASMGEPVALRDSYEGARANVFVRRHSYEGNRAKAFVRKQSCEGIRMKAFA